MSKASVSVVAAIFAVQCLSGCVGGFRYSPLYEQRAPTTLAAPRIGPFGTTLRQVGSNGSFQCYTTQDCLNQLEGSNWYCERDPGETTGICKSGSGPSSGGGWSDDGSSSSGGGGVNWLMLGLGVVLVVVVLVVVQQQVTANCQEYGACKPQPGPGR